MITTYATIHLDPDLSPPPVIRSHVDAACDVHVYIDDGSQHLSLYGTPQQVQQFAAALLAAVDQAAIDAAQRQMDEEYAEIVRGRMEDAADERRELAGEPF